MKQNNVKISITGGIGSGKSTFAKIIKQLGYPVFSCDEIYKTLQTQSKYLSRIRQQFGDQAVLNGKLNKEYLSSLVFSDQEQLKKLNELAHPLIMKRLDEEMSKYPLSFAEVPLLFEIHAEKQFDRIVIVTRDEKARLSAVMARDGLTAEQVLQRMKNQIEYQEKMKMGYTVIDNDGDMESLKCKAVTFLREIQK